MPTNTSTLSVHSLHLRATAVPGTWDESASTVEVVWATGGARTLIRPAFEEPFEEELSLEPEHVRMGRLLSGAPVLDAHGRATHRQGGSGLEDVIGVVLEARVDGRQGWARIRIADTERTREIRALLAQGILQNLSVGYQVHRYRDITQPDDEHRVLLAIDWEPWELSFVPMPADPRTHVRAGAGPPNQVVVEGARQMPQPTTGAPQAPSAEEAARAERERCLSIRQAAQRAGTPATQVDTWIREGNTVDEVRAAILEGLPPAGGASSSAGDGGGNGAGNGEGGASAGSAPEPANGAPQGARNGSPETAPTTGTPPPDAGALERTRCLELHRLGERTSLDPAFVRRHLEEGTALDSFRAAALEHLAARDESMPTRNHIRVGREEGDSVLEGVANALAVRSGQTQLSDQGQRVRVALSDAGQAFRGRSLLEIGRACLEVRGIPTERMTRNELAIRALGHGSSDFPQVLSNLANTTLRAAYEVAPRRWGPIARRNDASDFKPQTRVQLGEAPALKRLTESGEVTFGTFGEGAESYKLETYAKGLSFTRQLMVNDDLGAFTRMARMFGRAAAQLESDVVWSLITTNPAMGDEVPLFDAQHGNLLGAVALNVAGLSQARAKMALQKGLDGQQFLNIEPAYLIVPPSLETTAQQMTAQIQPDSAGNANPFASVFRGIITEARLEASSPSAWYIAADPEAFDVIEYAYLDGQDGPTFFEDESADYDGMRLRVTHDFGALVLDHRGLIKSAG